MRMYLHEQGRGEGAPDQKGLAISKGAPAKERARSDQLWRSLERICVRLGWRTRQRRAAAKTSATPASTAGTHGAEPGSPGPQSVQDDIPPMPISTGRPVTTTRTTIAITRAFFVIRVPLYRPTGKQFRRATGSAGPGTPLRPGGRRSPD
jgi:hypothetical protein